MASDSNFDMQPHVRTYGKVINLLKFGGIAVAIIAAFVIWLISR